MREAATILLTTPSPELGHAIEAAFPGTAVIDASHGQPPAQAAGRVLCFVDWIMPEISGLEMCRRLRDATATADGHITMVLDEDGPDLRRRALRAGADDYIAGPLTPAALVARIGSYLGAGSPAAPPRNRLMHGEIALDVAARQVRWRGRVIALRPNEFDLLVHFVMHPDRVQSRAALIAGLGKGDAAIDERTVDVWVGRLRRALRQAGAPDPLRTVRAMGYVLDGIEDESWRRMVPDLRKTGSGTLSAGLRQGGGRSIGAAKLHTPSERPGP